MSQELTQTATFNGVEYQITDYNGQYWLTAEQIGKALEYSEDNQRKAINNLYNRHNDEFTDEDTFVINLMTNPKGGNPTTRIFSKTGCIKLGFFANTPKAKQFRQWSANVLAKHDLRSPNLANVDLAQAQQQIAELTKRLQQMESLFCVREWGSVHPVAVEQDHEKQAVLDHRKNWRVIYEYVLQGLNSIEIGIKLDLDASGIRRHIREMRKCGILPPDPRQQALDLQKRLEQRHQAVLQHFAGGN